MRKGCQSWLIGLTAGFLLFAPGVASAMRPADYDAARKAATCAIRSDREAARDLAMAFPGGEVERRILLMPKIGRCMVKFAQGPDEPDLIPVFVGEIARKLWMARNTTFSSRIIGGSPEALALARARPHIPENAAGLPERVVIAACFVGAASNEANELIRSTPGSKAEDAAFAVVLQRIGPCVDGEKKFVVDRITLRAEINRAMYRYVNNHANLWH